MQANKWIRQLHRFVSVAFTVAVIINIVARGENGPPLWIAMLALIPLALLLVSGLYLFVQPYALKWRRARQAPASA